MEPRKCLFCGTPIHACMGYVLARDFLARSQTVRELCGKCVFTYEEKAVAGALASADLGQTA